MLLKDSLGGNSKTVMFANTGPADMNIAETISTLRFADRAKQIENKPVKNLDPKDQMIADLKEQIEDLKKRLARGGGGDVEKEQELEARIEVMQVERDQEKQAFERNQLDLEVHVAVGRTLLQQACRAAAGLQQGCCRAAAGLLRQGCCSRAAAAGLLGCCRAAAAAAAGLLGCCRDFGHHVSTPFAPSQPFAPFQPSAPARPSGPFALGQSAWPARIQQPAAGCAGARLSCAGAAPAHCGAAHHHDGREQCVTRPACMGAAAPPVRRHRRCGRSGDGRGGA
eukprot:gene57488-biopygen39695